MSPTAETDFDAIYRRIAGSQVVREIWRAAFGDAYPDAASPFSFVTRDELQTVADALASLQVRRVVDLGCGCGGPGLVVARQLGAALDGVDLSAVALQQAATTARQLGWQDRARFHQADAAATGLAGGAWDAVLSFDALQLMPEPESALAEAARLLRPGGRFAFTTWTLRSAWRGRAVLPDHRPLLQRHGFQVLRYDEPAGWQQRQRSVYRLTAARRDALEAELGADVAGLLVAEALAAPEALDLGQRVLGVAERM